MIKIRGFDGIRGIAIILVLLNHLDVWNSFPMNVGWGERFWPLISGETGVRMFFVLSGFLITWKLILNRQKNGRIDFRKFFILRSLRLFPAMIVFLGLAVFLTLAGLIDVNLYAFIYATFFAYNYLPAEHGIPQFAHLWSIAIEGQFYVIWPLFVSKIKGFSRWVAFVIACIVVFIAGKYLLLHHGPTLHYYVPRWFIPAGLPLLIGSFFGAMFALKLAALEKFKQHHSKIAVCAVIFLLAPLYVPRIGLHYSSWLSEIGIGLILFLISTNQGLRVISLLEFPPLKYLGRISYGLYLYHGLFIGTGGDGPHALQQFPGDLIISLVITIVSFELIEKPILKLRTRFVD